MKNIETIAIDYFGKQKEIFILHEGGKRSVFNQTTSAVDWAFWTWNPVTGCWHGCDFCYARAIANGGRMTKVYPKQFEPTFHPYRLKAPFNTSRPSIKKIRELGEKKGLSVDVASLWATNVFVGSMADIFGSWVPDEWINSIFESVKATPHWNYLFLTKYPQRLKEFQDNHLGGAFPDNCWIGTTVHQQQVVKVAQKAFEGINARVKWLSLEPLLSPLEFTDLRMFDLVAIGGQSSTNQPGGIRIPEFQPQWQWVENIVTQARASNTAVYFKDNLKCVAVGADRPKEFPSHICLVDPGVSL